MERKTLDYPRFDKRTREILRLAVNPPVVSKGKKERAMEAKEQERQRKKIGTIVTATKQTLLQARQLRDELANDPRFMERHGRKTRFPLAQEMPWNLRQSSVKEMVDNALAGTPEGDIPDDWESSLVFLPENCLDETFEEINAILGPENVENAHAILLRCLESENEGEDGAELGDKDDSDDEMAEVEDEGV